MNAPTPLTATHDSRGETRAAYWREARSLLSGLPAGGGLNIAYEAVDRHVDSGASDGVAIRWLGKHGDELRSGRFTRTVPLPQRATQTDVAAAYKSGILEVRLPVASPKPATKVPVSQS